MSGRNIKFVFGFQSTCYGFFERNAMGNGEKGIPRNGMAFSLKERG